MPRFDSITGPFNTTFSPNVQSELTMNWLAEGNGVSVEGQGEGVHDKNVRCSLIRLPGLKTFVTLPTFPVRGLFPGEFRLFAVGADHFYEIKSGPTIIDRSTPGFSGASGIGTAGGTIGGATGGGPVQFFSNGNQMMLISAGQVYIDNGNGPVPAIFSDPLTDLVVDPSDTSGKTLTTAVGNFFDASDQGRTVEITGGAGFNIGLTQTIASVDSSGRAIGGSAWGTPGANLGTGIEWMGVLTFTDLSLPVGINTVHSTLHSFGPGDIGTTLTITGGTGFTPGSYPIIGLTYDSGGNPTGDAIVFGNAGSIGATGGTGSIPAEKVTAFQGAFLDGYFFACPYPLTKNVFYSGAPDGSIDGFMWSPLNYYTKGDYPDNVNALFADHEEIYTCGDLESTEVFRDIGDANNPFAPDPGAFMHYGCQSPFSFSRLSNGVAWIAQDVRRGARRAVVAIGYNPQVVSTPAVQNAWRQYSRIDDAVGYTISYMGHELWVISFPTADAVWYYDVTTGWWGQWGNWNGTGWNRHKVWVHAVVALDGYTDVHYGGDYFTGQIYTMSETYKTDDGNPICRRRRSPHNTVENQRRFYARFEIDCDRLGAQRIFWNRLGAARDRIWQIDSLQSTETGGVTLTLGFSDDRLQSVQTMFTQTLDPSVDVTISNAYLKWADATWN